MNALDQAISNLTGGVAAPSGPESGPPPPRESAWVLALEILSGDGFKPYCPMTRGNAKIHDSVLVYNLPPVITCPNHKVCGKDCYAVKAYKTYPNVRQKYDYNLLLTQEHPALAEKQIRAQLDYEIASGKKITAIRLHSSGDFFDQSYVDLWERIVKDYPQIRIYTYTKAEKFWDFKAIEAHKNFNLIYSFIDGNLNFGERAYVDGLKAKYPQCYLCPAQVNKKIQCGGKCHYCIRGKYPLFVKH